MFKLLLSQQKNSTVMFTAMFLALDCKMNIAAGSAVHCAVILYIFHILFSNEHFPAYFICHIAGYF